MPQSLGLLPFEVSVGHVSGAPGTPLRLKFVLWVLFVFAGSVVDCPVQWQWG